MSEANGVLRNHYHPPGATIYIEKRLTNQSYRLFSQPQSVYKVKISSFFTIFQNIARLAVQGLAYCGQSPEPDGLGLAGLEDGKVGGGQAYLLSKLARRHFSSGKHYVYVYNDRHYS